MRQVPQADWQSSRPQNRLNFNHPVTLLPGVCILGQSHALLPHSIICCTSMWRYWTRLNHYDIHCNSNQSLYWREVESHGLIRDGNWTGLPRWTIAGLSFIEVRWTPCYFLRALRHKRASVPSYGIDCESHWRIIVTSRSRGVER